MMNPIVCAQRLAPQPPQPARPNPEPDRPEPAPAPDEGGEPVSPIEEGEHEEHRPGRASTRH